MGYPTSNKTGHLESAEFAVAVNISSTDHTLEQPSRALYVGTEGDLIVKMHGDPGTAITFTAVPAGALLPIAVKTIVKASTTAGAMVALF